jgi:nucleoside-diphosphate-sugar epimerase
MRIFVTEGDGYRGMVLVPEIIAVSHDIVILDSMWIGRYLEPHPRMK